MAFVKKLLFIILGSLCLLSGVNAITNDAILYYSNDNSNISGTTVYDISGTPTYDGTINGVTTGVTGVLNEALDWDGTNDYMTSSISDSPNGAISFWINLDATAGSFYQLISDRPSTQYIQIFTDSSNLLTFKKDDGAAVSLTTTTALTNNNWHHIYLSWGSNGMELYLDNVKEDSNIAETNAWTGTTTMYFGRAQPWATSYILDGSMDEIAFYDRQLTTAEITELYNSGNGYNPYAPSGSTPTISHDIQEFYNSENISINLTTATNTNMSYYLDLGSEVAICSDCNSTTLNLNSLSEGSHSILFESTDINGQVNSSANFTIDLTSPSINIFNTSAINSYLIDWTQHFNYSDTNLDSCFVTVENSTQNCSSYTFTENGNQTVQIYVNDSAGNSATDSYTQLVNPFQYFRFYDTARSLYVENYTFGSYSSSGQYAIIPLYDLGLGTQSLQFSKFGYGLENYQFNFNSTSALNQTFNATAVTITVKVYDESSPSTQLNFNLSMNNVSNYTQYLNQLNFEKYYNETLTGNLTLTIESAGYTLRKVFTELSPYSAVSHIIYLLADADSTPVVFHVLNLAQTQSIEDVVFTFKKEIVGVPTFLGQAKTDSQGYTYFNMDVLTDYEITISKDGYVTQVINSIPGKTDYTILMEEEGNTGSFLYDDFSYYITPLTASVDSIPFNASAVVFDEANLISSMRFTVTGDNTSETQVLTASSGGTIQFEITNASSQYVLNLTVMREGLEYNFIKKLNYYQTAATNATVQKVAQELEGEANNENRVFMIIIIYIVAVVLGSLFGPTIGAVCGLLPITIFAYVGWLTPGIAALMYVFTILGVLYFER